ncbi:MAG: hypothetical protein FVQ85_16025 [Planctomycetes bacterium]|nr:hypothetical protein [Planctomycetota bacterium]
MKWLLTYKKALVIAITLMLVGQSALAATAYVPVRISIKFILSSGGNRPATGNLNTDAEINGEFDWGNTILASNMSEFRIEKIQFLDLAGVSQHYNKTASSANRDALRSDAMASPGTYLWRTDAINIYINGGTGSAIGKFPPDNDIILMNQNCSNTPSCIIHEIGHNLNLMHTHQGGGADGCSDTIEDNSSWTRNQIAQNAYGKNYADCTAGEKDNVDLVFNNIMSYHTSEPQLRISTCQLGRVSTQGDSDRAWLLTRDPVYVRSPGGLFQFGTYIFPYTTIQAAVASGLSNEVLVLQGGSYTEPTSVMDGSSYVVTRSSSSYVGNGCLLYTLPTDLENSQTPEVSIAIKAVQVEDNAAREVMREAIAAVETVVIEEDDANKAAPEPEQDDTSPILANAEAARKVYEDNAISHLLDAEAFATGEERVAILLELAQRYKHSGDCTEAIGYFILVADNTTQPFLREKALFEANHCQEMLEKSWGSLVSEQQNVNTDEEGNPDGEEPEGPVIEKSPDEGTDSEQQIENIDEEGNPDGAEPPIEE